MPLNINQPPPNAPRAPSALQQARNQARAPGPSLMRNALSNASGYPFAQRGTPGYNSYPAQGGPAQQAPPTSNATPVGPTSQQILQAPYWNPSAGPSLSIMPPAGQKLTGNANVYAMSGMSQAQPTNTRQVTKTYNRDRSNFRLGEIISLPFHTPNTNPSLHWSDDRLRLSCKGPVFTKRRMCVILWIYKRDLFCLPLYSFEGKGLRSKSRYIQGEYVCLQNFDDKQFQPQGNYKPVVAEYINKPFHPDTTVHLTGGFKVGCIEDIAFCGRVNEESFNRLAKLWEQETKEARKQTYGGAVPR